MPWDSDAGLPGWCRAETYPEAIVPMSNKHTLIMLLCCLVPLAGFFLVSVLGIPLSSLGTVALVLLCPLIHILMMRGMGGHDHGKEQASCHPTATESKEPQTVANK